MKKGFTPIKIFPVLCCILLICGCFEIKPVININSEVKSKPDIYVRDCYKDSKKGDVHISGKYGVPLFAVENGEIIYVLENDSVYKYESDKKELVFKTEQEKDTRIGSLVYASDDYIIYLMMDTKPDGEVFIHLSDTIWKYSFESKTKQQIIDKHFSSFTLIAVDNNVIIRDEANYYFIDIESGDEKIIEDYQDKTEEELNNLLPTEFYEDNEEMIDANEILDVDFWCKTNCYDNKIYAFHLASDIIKDSGDNWIRLRYGSSEGCETEHWNKDVITYLEGPDYSNSEEKTLYEDSTNRILGYNPDTNEVYLYVFENGTITAKDLDDGSEKVIETLKEAEAIQFEWIDIKLYWMYINGDDEEYGGCHEFN